VRSFFYKKEMEKIITTLIAIIRNVKLRHWYVSISLSLTADYEGVVVSSAGSPPFKPKSFPPSWASDGEEPPPPFSTHINAIIRLTSSTEWTWMPHRDCNLIYCVYMRPDGSLTREMLPIRISRFPIMLSSLVTSGWIDFESIIA